MKKILSLTLYALAILTLAACHPDPVKVQMTFNATLEQPVSDDSSKVYMLNERWIYWETDDEISVAADNSAGYISVGRLVNTGGSYGGERFNGVFLTTLDEGAKYFLGLHPANDMNRIVSTGSNNFSAQIYLPDIQGFRVTPTADGVDGDHTFDKQVYPMVAWYGGEKPVPDFDFHALAGMVRLNLFDNSNSPKILSSITLTSSTRQLKGHFNVNNYKTEDPYLTSASDLPGDKTLTISCGDGGRSFATDTLLTFYIPLPALGGRGITTSYSLTMVLTATDGSTFTKNFTVPIRRTGITNMKALGVDNWSTGRSIIGLSGCGTESRPYKIYDTTDLKYLRDCYNKSGERTINGRKITPNTWIALMRSDLVINDTNWKSGINNFVGHFVDRSGQVHHPGITSRSSEPLFSSIGQGGVVDGITLKCGSTFAYGSGAGMTPFCITNLGIISNCVISSEPDESQRRITSAEAPLAGLCIENWGTIEGCRNEARMEVQQQYDVAGICLTNHNGANIIGCHISSEMKVYATANSHVAGICLENLSGGTVRDCYFATSVTSVGVNDASWGGIVYYNSGLVEHCYLSATGHIYTQKTVGGIVAENSGATSKVNYCWIAGQVSGIQAGGIVQSLSDGYVINCFSTGSPYGAIVSVTTSVSVGGGLVGTMTGGNILNCFVDDIDVYGQNAIIGGIVGKVTGGIVKNCYDNEQDHALYGEKTGSATITHCYMVDGTQNGITSISMAHATAAAGQEGALVDLLNDTGDGAHSPILAAYGAKPWVQSGNIPPTLATYTGPSPSSKHRK